MSNIYRNQTTMFLPTKANSKPLQFLEHEGHRQEIDGHTSNANSTYQSGVENV